jgi:hypothetical protein
LCRKNAIEDQEGNTTAARLRLFKESLVDFSYALGIPGKQFQTTQLNTRSGGSKEEGQMLFRKSVRSGEYALIVRYKAYGVGADTERRVLVVADQAERAARHKAILSCLKDLLLNPAGAMTPGTLAQLEGIEGAICVETHIGRAFAYSALDDTFIDRIMSMAGGTAKVYPFYTVEAFNELMDGFINHSQPQQSFYLKEIS